jgi:hypothetical protein
VTDLLNMATNRRPKEEIVMNKAHSLIVDLLGCLNVRVPISDESNGTYDPVRNLISLIRSLSSADTISGLPVSESSVSDYRVMLMDKIEEAADEDPYEYWELHNIAVDLLCIILTNAIGEWERQKAAAKLHTSQLTLDLPFPFIQASVKTGVST